jgi:hypothetical protein
LLEHPETCGLSVLGVGLHGTVQTAVSTRMTAPCGGTQQTRPGAHGRWNPGSGCCVEYVAQTSPWRAGTSDAADASTPASAAALSDAPSRGVSGLVAKGCGVQDATTRVMQLATTIRTRAMRDSRGGALNLVCGLSCTERLTIIHISDTAEFSRMESAAPRALVMQRLRFGSME